MITNLTKIYFKIVAATILLGICIILGALIANFFGQLWIPGLMFLGCISLKFILTYSPPAVIFSGVAACYTLIPFVGDMSVGRTAQDLHDKIKNLLENVLTAMALIMLFLFTIHIDSFSFSRKLSIAFLFGMGFAILTWYSTKVKSKTIVWKAVFLAGILTIVKASALLWPSPIHDTLGIYPGVVVDRSKINRDVFHTAQTDADILTAREQIGVAEFVDLLKKYNAKNPHIQLTSEELIAQRSALLKDGVITESQSLIIKREAARRESTPTKKVINKTSEVGRAIKKVFASEPEPRLVKSVQYKPREWGPSGMTIAIPDPSKPYTVECKGSYNQLFYSGSTIEIPCWGFNNNNMARHEVILMPYENRKICGKFFPDEFDDHVVVKVNMPQTHEAYKDITGFLTVNIYQ